MKIWPMFSSEAKGAARVEEPEPAFQQRYALGLAWQTERREVAAAIIEARDKVRRLRPRVAAELVRPISPEMATISEKLVKGEELSSHKLVDFAAAASEQLVAAAQELLCQADSFRKEMLLAGLRGPALWHYREHAPAICLPLVEPSALAETTGLNVVDDFAARDLVQGGQGGPLEVLPQWLLLADRKETAAGRTRVLLELGPTTGLTYLPSGTFDDDLPALYGFNAGPGLALLTEIWRQADRHEQVPPLQLASRAAQGRLLPGLLEGWLADPLLNERPSWSPAGLPQAHLAEEALATLAGGESLDDLLCTAVHLVAEATARAIERHLPLRPTLDGLILNGPGQQCGLLVKSLGERLPALHVKNVSDLGVSEAALPAVSAAILAMLYIDQAPAGQPSITGAEVPRLLGRLTPGSPSRWQKLLGQIAENRPATLPLRYAV